MTSPDAVASGAAAGSVKADVLPAARSTSCGRPRTSGTPPPYVATSFRLSIINWLTIASLYVPYVLGVASVAAAAMLMPKPLLLQPSVFVDAAWAVCSYALSNAAPLLILALAVYYTVSMKPSVYLVDFAVYEPPADWQVTHADLMDCLRAHRTPDGECVFTEESLDFMARLLERRSALWLATFSSATVSWSTSSSTGTSLRDSSRRLSKVTTMRSSTTTEPTRLL